MPDRKYRQRGYQDSQSRGGDAGARPSGRPDRPEGPRGRGVGAPRDEVFRCKNCGERASAEAAEVKPESTCAKCGAALHACVQCRHFDTLARFQCRREIPIAIAAKTKANDCALYEPAISMDLKGKTTVDTPDQARSAFDKLFGKK